MKHLSPLHKHSILLEYRQHSHDHSFAALASRHGIKGGKQVVMKWYSQWNGTAESLKEKSHSGRPRILTTPEIQRYIAPRIRAANRSSHRIHYTDIHSAVEKNTGKHISLRTLQHYGKEELHGRKTHGNKRTADESEYTETRHIDAPLVCNPI
jgi:transposase